MGRTEDLAELRSALGRSRLVTLVGPGGIGKSRLAREFAARIETIFPGGAWIVELADISSPEMVTPAAARALGISQNIVGPLEERIARTLNSSLLILDNCEHIIDASADLVTALLAASPSVRIVATSRAPLELRGETSFALAPLAIPERPDDLVISEYTNYASIQLFVDRVAARDRAFRVTDDNLPLIASICASVGGVPLALELAAGRASRVTLTTLADQMQEQLGFEALHRDVPERHRSMRTALATTYDALDMEEQDLWRRLSTFRGGSTLSAAQEMCAFHAVSEDVFDHALDGLIERSIVSLDSATAGGRYQMLEPIRLFGLEQARLRGEEQQLRRAHLDWCSTLIPPEAWTTGVDQLRHMRAFQTEHSNIAAALDYCLEENEVAAGLQLFASVFLFWGLSGWYREECRYAESLLRATRRPSEARTIALAAAGLSSWYTHRVAQRWFERAQTAARSDPRGRGLARFGLGYCAIMSEAYDRAIPLLEDACRLLEESETAVMQGRARYALSQALALGKRDYAAARAAVEPNLALISPDDIWNREMTQLQLGLLDWRLGAVEDAESRLVEALTLAKELAHPFGIAACLEILAWVAMTRDEPARAAQLVGYAHGLFDRTGTNFVTGLTADQHDAAERMREQLGSGRYRVLTQAGAEMSENEVMRLAQRQVAAPDEHQDASLTAREREVAKLIAGGATNTQISLQLLIGHETVKTHVRSILRKLGLDSRVQIAAWYATGGRDGQQNLGR